MNIEYCDHCGIALIKGYKSLNITNMITAHLCDKDADELFEYMNKYLHLPSHQPQMHSIGFLPRYYEESCIIREKPFVEIKHNVLSRLVNFIISACYEIDQMRNRKDRFQ